MCSKPLISIPSMRISGVDIPVSGHPFVNVLATNISPTSICVVTRQASPRKRYKHCLPARLPACPTARQPTVLRRSRVRSLATRIVLILDRLTTQYKQVQIFGHRGKPDCGIGGCSPAMCCDAATTQQAAWAKPHVRKVSSTWPSNGYRRQPL
jgi:hypothetical protein